MKLYLAQINTRVGDLDGNAAKSIAAIQAGRELGAALVILPELTITGYPPRDLLDRPRFVRDAGAALERVAVAARGVAALVGCVEPNRSGSGNALFNAAVLCAEGRIVARVAKRLLPTYDVFDEDRHFEPGSAPGIIAFGGSKLGVSVCEDAWTDPALFGRRLYDGDPIADLARGGAQILLNISASPFALGRPAMREKLFAEHASRHGLPIACVNLVGGNDELLFDGRSFVIDGKGRKLAELANFREDAALVDLERATPLAVAASPDDASEAHQALVMGTRDYAEKCGFAKAVVGLSGGIDSAVVAVIAAEALGPAALIGVAMPSRYSSDGSVTDAKALAVNLGIRTIAIPIEAVHAAYLASLTEGLGGPAAGVTAENIQARIRGNFLMALSNTFGWLVLTTGNKSEMAVGYTTLYGDMSGGLAVLSDVPKTLVYKIARAINARRSVIPNAVLVKPPSAELRPGQLDQETLPPYEVLDAILKRYVEDARSIEEIVAEGYDAGTVRDVVRRVTNSEYKRKQAPPGLRITTKAFGLGRRMPIAQGYREWAE